MEMVKEKWNENEEYSGGGGGGKYSDSNSADILPLDIIPLHSFNSV